MAVLWKNTLCCSTHNKNAEEWLDLFFLVKNSVAWRTFLPSNILLSAKYYCLTSTNLFFVTFAQSYQMAEHTQSVCAVIGYFYGILFPQILVRYF